MGAYARPPCRASRRPLSPRGSGYVVAVRRFLIASTLLAALAAPAAADARVCSNTYGGDVISTRDVSCAKAHKIVRTWARKYKDSGGDPDHRVKAFSCRGSSDSVEGLVIRCKQADRSVRFYANVP